MGVFRNVLNWYARLTPGRYNLVPPYEHITQIGDPILRTAAQTVAVADINSEAIQKTIMHIRKVMQRYKCTGLAAPQIGVNKRIIAVEYRKEYNTGLTNDYIKSKQIYVVPFTVFINPTWRVLDYTQVSHSEGCESIRGYHALVPRYRSIEVTAYNEKAEQVTQSYEGWAARMIQHEIDHLNGKFYIDIMDNTTFECICWQEVNLSRGKVELPFYP